ncbi:hypothetical protein NliqN6_1883 [Naganishia liquefaciens]|uniref:MobA-like NTP transferase domain-containing protein n=1 Tax=Naganishia liquefaciens TaxID=104408 RepID=A0A8H3YF97_9TREE|nr:hypothetical protein NliqN6_1883 [Naganishia liquefaciens]
MIVTDHPPPPLPSANPDMYGLLVLGGQSTRMGRDKAFLDYPVNEETTQPLYLRLLNLLHQACPAGVYISHNTSQAARLHQGWLPPRTVLVPDDPRIIASNIGGPAAGLLSSHLAKPDATFLVLAVDFPLVTLETLTDLSARYTPPVTCYLHASDAHPEPLLSVWGPEALDELRENAMGEMKKTGPCWTARRIWKRLGVETVGDDGKQMQEGKFVFKPREQQWLFNTNEPEEWEKAKSILCSRTSATQ